MNASKTSRPGKGFNSHFFQTLVIILFAIYSNIYSLPANKNNVQPANENVSSSKLKDNKAILAEISRLDTIIAQCQRTIKLYPDRDFSPNTMFQLSKLYLKREKLAFEFKLDKFIISLERFDKGLLKEEPQEPKIAYEPSIKLCERIFEHFPEVEFKENLLYWYGLCLFENSEREQATKIFQTLAKYYPKTTYLDEIDFRIGEHFFDIQRYDKAIATYSKAIKDWDNSFFAMALYKLAWSYYKIDNYSQSISTFFYLLNDLDMIDSLKCAEIGRSAVDLKEESTNYIAICFSEYGGLSLAKNFLKDMKGDNENRIRILHRLADVYRKRSYYDKSLEIYNEILKKYPYYYGAPEIQNSIFCCYNIQEQEVKALKARERLAKLYGPKSKWAQKNPGAELQAQRKEYLKNIDFILATPIINKADELLSGGNLEEAVDVYRNFVRNFPADERAPRALFNAGECYYDLKKYKKSAKMYLVLVKAYAPHELTEDAAYNRVICYDQLFQLETISKPDTLFLVIARKKRKICTNSHGQKRLLMACNDFVIAVPKGDKTVEILLKTAEQLMKLEHHKLAENILHKAIKEITKRHYGQQFYTQAASLMAQVFYKQQKYKYAEKWYAIVAQSASDSAQLSENSRKMMASSRYKIAEKFMAKGDSTRAAKEFERVALRYGNSEIGERSTYEAAVQYEKSGNLKKAARLFELFARRYHESEHVEQSNLKAARIRESLGDWKKAAQNYMKVYQLNPSSELAPIALYSAGTCYENCENWSMTALLFSKYHKLFQKDVAKTVEAMFKEGYAYYMQKKYANALNSLKRMLYTHDSMRQKNIEVDDYYAAQAKFTMAEIEFRQFQAIKLDPPFNVNMQRKQRIFSRMMQNYTATTKYEIAEWTTAAFHKIGSACEVFSRDIMDSPPPENTTDEQLKTYREALWQKLARPFKVKALEYYRANDKLATKISITNEWIEQSRQKITELTSELSNNSQLSSQAANISKVAVQN